MHFSGTDSGENVVRKNQSSDSPNSLMIPKTTQILSWRKPGFLFEYSEKCSVTAEPYPVANPP